MFADVGSNNPRYNCLGEIDFRLGRQLIPSAYSSKTSTNQHPPRPLLLPLVRHPQATIPLQPCLAWLLLPPAPRRLLQRWQIYPYLLIHPGDTQFFIRAQSHNTATAPTIIFVQTKFVILFFTNQNNVVKGESIRHVRAGHPQALPVAALHHRVAHLIHNNSPGDTPLSSVYIKGKERIILRDKITATIFAIICADFPIIGFTKTNVNAQYLHAGSAMAILLEWFYTDTIRLVGRWQSNTVIRYLHITTNSFTQGLSACMVQHNTYALIPPVHTDL